LVLLAFAGRFALSPLLQQRAALLPFIPAVVLAAGLYGVGPGLLAICLSALVAIWAFMLPGETPVMTPDEIANVVVFLVIGAAMLIFANHLRQARNRAEMLEIDLQQAQATAAMGTMAATLAHELNQPLTAASNYVAACRQLAPAVLEEKGALLLKGLDQAESQIQRAGSIIRSARSLVRNTASERGAASLSWMFGRVMEVTGATRVGANVRFTINVSPEADRVFVNPVQIEQVLLNLIRNACEAMQTSRKRGQLLLKATKTERGSLTEVRDNGPGIPRDRLPTLFSASRSPTGTGLGIGLSISRTIIEAHGGSIWAQNNPDGGASFFILLPAQDDAD
jgi:two-component system sensor kinase FixL